MSIDDLEGRLRRLGQAPITPEVEATHRHAIAQAASGRPRARFGWRAVALASLAGFFAGSTALASAGSLPAPAQDIAHDTLGAVGISVPRSSEGCPEGTSYRNHGEYVSAVEASGGDVRAAAHSSCGMPVHAGKGNGNKAGAAPGARPDRDGDPCTGPPPWAGTHLDAEAIEVARAERAATCGPDDDGDDVEDAEVEPDDAKQENPATKSGATTTVPVATTTVADTTTTTAAETTTTTAAETTTTTTQP